MNTVFLTGATGFIGRHVAAALLARGCEVRCLVRSSAKAAHLRHDGLRIVVGTLTDDAGWRSALAGCDTVINVGGLVAARSVPDLFQANGHGPALLADACAALESPPRLVHVSSLAAAGPTPAACRLRVEADPPAPISNYGASKRAGEAELERRADRVPVTIIRPGVVFGPHDRNFSQIFQFVNVVHAHLQMGYREPPLSLIHVTDLVGLMLAAAERGDRLPADGSADGRGIYFACDDREHPTYGEIGRRVARALGHRRVLVAPLPMALAWPCIVAIEKFWHATGQASIVSPDKLREATASSWASSAARSRDHLGFAPRATLDERLGETAAWLRDNGRL